MKKSALFPAKNLSNDELSALPPPNPGVESSGSVMYV